MSKTLLGLLLICSSFFSYSQCTPLVQFADSTFGVWPDTVLNLPHAVKNISYLTTLHLKAPANATELGFGTSISIDNLEIESVSGMPTGFTYECDNSQCSWAGGNYGCFSISGTPMQAGVYTIDIHAVGAAGGGLISAPYVFSGYELIVDEVASITEKDLGFSVAQNIPNPFLDNTTIKYSTSENELVVLTVYSILGELIYSSEQNSTIGENSFQIETNLTSGNYYYKVSNTSKSIVKKMVVVSN